METSSGNSSGRDSVRMKPAAARLGFSVRTLYREIADGKLRLDHHRRCACIEESELQNYVERNRGGKNYD
jgi:excisionase family DNA binding protein